MAGKPGIWAKGQKVVKTVDLGDGTTAEGVIIVDSAGNPVVGTGGGAATIADGADVAQGTTSDVAWVAGSGTVISLLKKIASAGGSAVSIADGADVAQGTTTDLSSASTVVGLLKNIKAALAGALSVAQSGTWTVQPGNTANTTAWKVDGSAVTQPVSGPLTDTQLRNSAVPVSGPVTDTQLRATPVPVSGTVTATTGGLTDTQLRASAVPVSSTQLPVALGSGTTAQSLKVALASDQVAIPVTDNAGTLTVDAPVGTPVFARLSDGSAALVGSKVSASSLPVVIASDQGAVAVNDPGLPDTLGQKTMANSAGVVLASDQASIPVSATLVAETTKVIGTVNPPAVTKGTQGANGFTTQDLKDAGRSQIMVAWEEMAGTAAAESALTNYTLASRALSAVGAATSLTVTTGKTLRIQEIHIYTKATSTVNNLCRFRIRAAGTVANTSPVIWDAVLLGVDAPGTIAAGLGTQQVYSIPDGLEVSSTTQIAFTWFTAANTCTVGMTIIGYEY